MSCCVHYQEYANILCHIVHGTAGNMIRNTFISHHFYFQNLAFIGKFRIQIIASAVELGFIDDFIWFGARGGIVLKSPIKVCAGSTIVSHTIIDKVFILSIRSSVH